MSPKDKKGSSGPVRGSGPDGKVEIGDIRAKLGEIRGDIDQATEDAKPYLVYAAVAGAVALVAIAFIAGRRMGRRKATWVEIKRL
jgi:hypothetical protein